MNPKNKNLRRSVFITILILLGLSIGIMPFINTIANSTLNKKLNSVIGNNIHVEATKSLINVFTGDIIIENLTVFQKLDTLSKIPNFEFSIDTIQIFNMNMVSFISSGKLICDSILLEKPYINFGSIIKDSTKKYKLLKRIIVEKLKVNNAATRFNAGNKVKCDSLYFELTNLDFPIDKNVSIASLSYGNFSCSATNINYTHDGMYRYRVGSFKLLSSNEFVDIKNFQVIPLYSKNSFAKVLDRESERITFTAPVVKLINFDLNAFLFYDSLLIRKIIVDNYDLEVFKDKRLARPKKLSNKPLPQELIRNIKFPIKIDSIVCSSGNILFEGCTTRAKHSGKIGLTKANALLRNICNISNELNLIQLLKIDFDAVIANQGKLKAKFNLPLINLNQPMIFSGSLSKMDLRQFNSILEPFSHMYVEKGQLNSLSFNVVAFPNKAKGNLVMNYNGLNVSINKINNRDLIEDTGLESVINILVNGFIIKKDNPSGKKPLREGEIYFEPDKTRFIVHYWLNSIFSGIPESLGIPQKVCGKIDN